MLKFFQIADMKLGRINPLLFRNPLHFLLIIPIKWILNQTVPHQIRMNHTRHLRRIIFVLILETPRNKLRRKRYLLIRDRLFLFCTARADYYYDYDYLKKEKKGGNFIHRCAIKIVTPEPKL